MKPEKGSSGQSQLLIPLIIILGSVVALAANTTISAFNSTLNSSGANPTGALIGINDSYVLAGASLNIKLMENVARATLTLDNGTLLEGKQIDFYMNDTLLGSGLTNAEGFVDFPIGGNDIIKVVFNGDLDYSGSQEIINNVAESASPRNDSETEVSNIVIEQGQAEINKPVRWIKRVKGSISDVQSQLPAKAFGASVNEMNGERVIEYYTEAPKSYESVINDYRKLVTISSDIEYRNIKTYTSIRESPEKSIRLYWLVDGNRMDVTKDPAINLTFFDTNNNGFIDRLEWITPHTSNQTFEVSIIILNVNTFVRNGENWTVAFEATGTADLVINSTNAKWTEFLADDPNTKDEMKLLDISCGNNSLKNSLELMDENENYYNYSQLNESDSIRIKKLLIRNYSCDGTGYITNNMIIAGYAALQFTFGDQVAYAYDTELILVPNNIGNKAFYNNTGGSCNVITALNYPGTNFPVNNYTYSNTSNNVYHMQSGVDTKCNFYKFEFNTSPLSNIKSVTLLHEGYHNGAAMCDAALYYYNVTTASWTSWTVLDTAETNISMTTRDTAGIINNTGYVKFAVVVTDNNQEGPCSVTSFTDLAMVSVSDDLPPTYSSNSTNSSLAGKNVEFRLKWADDNAMHGYIFAIDNCTGTLTNNTSKTFGRPYNYTTYTNGGEDGIISNPQYAYDKIFNDTSTAAIFNSSGLLNWIHANYTFKVSSTSNPRVVYTWRNVTAGMTPNPTYYPVISAFNYTSGDWKTVDTTVGSFNGVFATESWTVSPLSDFISNGEMKIRFYVFNNYSVEVSDVHLALNESWSNETFVINNTVNCQIRWCYYANDTLGNWNNSCSSPFTFNTTEATPPTYARNTTNTTIAGTPANFSLEWNDSVALNNNGKWIFSTNNSGTWQNYTLTDVLVPDIAINKGYASWLNTPNNQDNATQPLTDANYSKVNTSDNNWVQFASLSSGGYAYTHYRWTFNLSNYDINALTSICYRVEGYYTTTGDGYGMITTKNMSSGNWIDINNMDQSFDANTTKCYNSSAYDLSQFINPTDNTFQIATTANASNSYFTLVYIDYLEANISNLTKFTATPQNATWALTLNSAAGTKVAWCFYAKDNVGNWNGTNCQNDNTYFYVTTTETTPPQWVAGSNSTNTTSIGLPANFTLNWTDNYQLAGYIFSTNNTGTWQNSSYVSFSGTSNKSWNVTALNSTAGTIVGWCFYANDTSGNMNATNCQVGNEFYLNTTEANVSFTVRLPDNINYSSSTSGAPTADEEFNTTATTIANVSPCIRGAAQCQTELIANFIVNNTGTVNENITICLNQSLSSKFAVWGTLTNDPYNGVNIIPNCSYSAWKANESLPINAVDEFWIWTNFTNVVYPDDSTVRMLYINATQSGT